MPSSAVHTFADPDEYAAVFPATSAELTITGRGQFIANVTRIDLHRLWMLRYSVNLPLVKHSTNITGRTIIAFRRQHGPGLFFNGKEMHSGNIKQLGPGQSDNQQSAGLASVGVMSLPVEDMASVAKETAGIELEPTRDGLIVTPPTPAMAKLQRLHAAATYLAESAPEIIGHHEAARGLEQALIEAVVACLTTADDAKDRAAQRRHEAILHRFRAGGNSRSSAVYTGTLQGDRGVGPDIAGVLPRAARHEPQAIPAVAPHASRTASFARQRLRHNNGDGNRHTLWLLAFRPLRR